MKKIALLLPILLLCGCATYKFHHGTAPYDKGYIVSREDYTIVEYTLGRDNTVPKIDLAKERFKRRKARVEDSYKRMGYIENRFKMAFWDPCTYFFKLVGGVFRLPFIAISDYRQGHDPVYKQRVRAAEQRKDSQEDELINKLKNGLQLYIDRDLDKYEGADTAPGEDSKTDIVSAALVTVEKAIVDTSLQEPARIDVAAVKEEPVVAEEVIREEVITEELPGAQAPLVVEQQEAVTEVAPLPVVKKEKPVKKPAEKPAKPVQMISQDKPQAVIVANPVKGYSPLRVSFSARRSRVRRGRIVSYHWDFGDGDTSDKPACTNTYYSGVYGTEKFEVTLTVQDDKGNTASSVAVIQVLNK